MTEDVLADRLGDLRPADRRWLDRVGKVGDLRADDAEVEHGELEPAGIVDDTVVEQAERRNGLTLEELVGGTRVVNRADGGGQAAIPDPLQHPAVVALEAIPAVREQ